MRLIRNYQRFLTFAVVGGINSGVDAAVFALIYLTTALPIPVVQAISYVAGVISSFILNRNITFRDGAQSQLSREAVLFIAVNLVSWAASIIGIHFLTLAGLSTVIAKILITALAGLINYFGFKIFVFRVKGR